MVDIDKAHKRQPKKTELDCSKDDIKLLNEEVAALKAALAGVKDAFWHYAYQSSAGIGLTHEQATNRADTLVNDSLTKAKGNYER